MKRLKFLSIICLLLAMVISSTILPGCNKKEPRTTSTSKNDSKSTTKQTTSVMTKTSFKSTTTASLTGITGDNGDEEIINENDSSNDESSPTDNETGNNEINNNVHNRPEYSYNFNGRTILLGIRYGIINSPVQYPFNIDRNGPHIYGTNDVQDLYYDWARECEAKFNCKIEIVSYAQDPFKALTRFSTETLAGINTIDVFLDAPLYCMPTIVVKNLIVPLSDYINFDADPYLSDPFIKNSVTYAGKQWGLYTGEAVYDNGIIYNLDIRDKDGLEDPMELALKGQWNWEKFVEVLKNATHDFNGDGIVDQWGMALIGPFAQCFVLANKGTIVEYNDERFNFSALNPATIRALTFISDLYNVHKVAKRDWYIYRNGLAFMDNAQPSYNQMTDARVSSIKRYRHVAYPVGPDNNDGKITMATKYDAVYIPITSQDKEGLAQFVAAFFQTYNNPELIVDPKKVAQNDLELLYKDDQTAIDYWINERRNIDSNIINWGQWGTPFTKIMNWVADPVLSYMARPNISVRQYIDSIFPEMQAEIDDLSNQ